MKNSHIFISALAVFMVMSCSGPVKNEANQSSNVLVQEQDPQQENAIDGQTSPAVSAQESNQAPAELGEAQVMLNPPHGEPFHRCDIPVGSPLPGAAPVASANQAPAEKIEPQVMLNPPHGEPYHRCDIPVGSPLPATSPQQATTTAAAASSPATATSAPAASPATVDRSMIPTIENVNRLNTSAGRQSTSASSTPPTGTPPRNNPPHGQPWHRCDIPVGSPLPVN